MPKVINKVIACVFACLSCHSYGFEIFTEFQQGAVLIGQADDGEVVIYDDKELKLTEDGYFVVGLDRDAPKSVSFTVKQRDSDDFQIHQFDVKQREYRLQKIEGVPQSTVTPNPEQVARSRKEGALAWNARNHNSDLSFFKSEFQWPLIGPITGVYGSQRIYNGVPKRPHYGVDIARPTGTRVVAPAAGVVRLAYADMFFSGGTLIVDHGHGLSSTFIHLSKILVEPGQMVEPGDEIAEVGATGRVTGPHLDWRMNWFDKRVDPQLLVGPMSTQ
jgi:murein DD-endopeptidase MepM/ murein hydrolase activator NlpD